MAGPALDLTTAPEGHAVLVVGTDDWAVEQGAARLEAAGHEVLRCHEPGEAPFPCNALRAGRRCPVEVGIEAVLDVRSRPTPEPVLAELGVLCALRAGVPLVVAGPATTGGYTPWADQVAEPSAHIVDVLLRALRAEPTGAPA